MSSQQQEPLLTTVEIASDASHPHHRNAQRQLTEGTDLLQLTLIICEAEIRYEEELYKRGGEKSVAVIKK
jgi:hypothetical protein